MMWLSIPACVVSAHLRMLPVLAAEESQTRVAEVAVGAAVEPGDWAGDQLEAWRRVASRYARRRVAQPSNQDLAAAGIGVRVKER